MAVSAVDSEFGEMMLVAEGRGLVQSDSEAVGIGRYVGPHENDDSKQKSGSRQTCLRQHIAALPEYLRHCLPSDAGHLSISPQATP
jgi:hypothetical protein